MKQTKPCITFTQYNVNSRITNDYTTVLLLSASEYTDEIGRNNGTGFVYCKYIIFIKVFQIKNVKI